MRIELHHVYSMNPEERELVRAISIKLTQISEVIMSVSPEVQSLLDLAKQNTSVIASLDLAMKALNQQVADLKNQIATQSPSLSVDDKAALTQAASELQNSISTAQADIPANTGAVPQADPAAPTS
jgi:hypothetical protein